MPYLEMEFTFMNYQFKFFRVKWISSTNWTFFVYIHVLIKSTRKYIKLLGLELGKLMPQMIAVE